MIGLQRTQSSLEFPYEIAWARSYAELFRSECTHLTDIDHILEAIARDGRVLLVGKGGSGKTSILQRVKRLAHDRQYETVFVDMRQWSPDLQNLWENLAVDSLVRANFLLRYLSDPASSLSAIDGLDPGQWKLILIDGLNEVRSTIAEQVIGASDRMAGTFMNVCVLASDRLVRREIDESRWALGAVQPLKKEVVQKILHDVFTDDTWRLATVGQRHMLEIPFFLDKALQDQQVTTTTSEAVEHYLQRHASLNENEIDIVATGAFNTYRSGGAGRSFPLSQFVKDTSSDVAQRLGQSGILRQVDDSACFEHHLLHDYLAARHLSAHRKKWGQRAFDAISFEASSFDAISKVLELVEAGSADDFVRQVYDWNPYAASYALAETVSSNRRVSEEMEHVITAMLAERLWDVVRPTAVRAGDALALLGSEKALSYLNARTIEEVLAEVGLIKSEIDWFSRWQELYTRPPHEQVQGKELRLLQESDSVLGWTAANVIRRLELDDAQQEYVRQLAAGATGGTVRWRSVHVLGAFPSKFNQDALLARLREDQDGWVRYGALRSVMEMAARSELLRQEVFEALIEQVDVLARDRLLRAEFSRAANAKIEEVQTGSWIAGIGSIIRALADRSEDERDLEEWARLSHELEVRYAA